MYMIDNVWTKHSCFNTTFNSSLLSKRLQMMAKGMNITITATTVAKTAIASKKFAKEKTVLKSMVFGPTKTPAPRLPKRLLLNRAFFGDVPS